MSRIIPDADPPMLLTFGSEIYFSPDTATIAESAPTAAREATPEVDIHMISSMGESIYKVSISPLYGDMDTTPLTSELSDEEYIMEKYPAYSHPVSVTTVSDCTRGLHPAARMSTDSIASLENMGLPAREEQVHIVLQRRSSHILRNKTPASDN